MKRFFSVLFAAVLFASPLLTAPLLTSTPLYAKTDYTTGTPWLCSDLEGNVTADTPTNVKDDFALYANKEQILALEIPEGFTSAGTSTDLTIQNKKDFQNMFLGDVPESHDARLAYSMHQLINDWEARDAQGVAPLKKMIDTVEEIKDLKALTDYFTKTPIEDRLFCLWRTYIRPDLDNANKKIIYIIRPACLLGDPAEYRKLTPEGTVIKKASEDYFEKMLLKLGYSKSEASKKIENAFALETMLMSACMDQKEMNRPDYDTFTNNHYSRAQLQKEAGNVPLVETLEQAEAFPVQKSFLVREPDFIKKLAEVYNEKNISLLRDYLIVNGINEFAYDLDWDSYVMAETYEYAKDGTEYPGTDKKKYLENSPNMILRSLGWPMAQLYVERYVDPEDKERITRMVDEIVNAYHGIIEEADFLSQKTRAAAIDKLDSMGKQILYPDDWTPYSYNDCDFASSDQGGSYWEATRAVQKYEHAKEVAGLQKPVDKTLWNLYPMSINCEYDQHINCIFILAGYARGDNYNSDMSDEELYAKLGSVIGHEISHAFDPYGAMFDKEGSMVNWWTDEEMEAFKEKSKKLAAYYDAIHPWEGQDLNGEIMTGEACADMAAIKCMLRLAAQKPGFDYDRFFRAYADHYLTKDKMEVIKMRLEDVHPMYYLRINTVLQQYDDFLNFYDIHEGDGMYLAPKDRVAIW